MAFKLMTVVLISHEAFNESSFRQVFFVAFFSSINSANEHRKKRIWKSPVARKEERKKVLKSSTSIKNVKLFGDNSLR